MWGWKTSGKFILGFQFSIVKKSELALSAGWLSFLIEVQLVSRICRGHYGLLTSDRYLRFLDTQVFDDFNLRFVWAAATCLNLRWLWSSLNSCAIQRSFFLPFDPTQVDTRWSQINCICVKFTTFASSRCLATHRKSACKFWFRKLALTCEYVWQLRYISLSMRSCILFPILLIFS